MRVIASGGSAEWSKAEHDLTPRPTWQEHFFAVIGHALNHNGSDREAAARKSRDTTKVAVSSWLPVTDDPHPLTAAEYRERNERARAQARARYSSYLADVLGERAIADPAGVADAALAALTEWTDIETGERCRCSCHPQLPSSDLHDSGFDCNCTRTRDQRRNSIHKLLNDIDEYWKSPEGLEVRAADDAVEGQLHAWLAQQQGVAVDSHGGWAPEQWRGTVDGHRFYFRERGGDWDLESTSVRLGNPCGSSTATTTTAPPTTDTRASNAETSSRPAPSIPTATEPPLLSAPGSSSRPSATTYAGRPAYCWQSGYLAQNCGYRHTAQFKAAE